MVFRLRYRHRSEPRGLLSLRRDKLVWALSSAWTEHLASDQDVAGSNPAAPICLRSHPNPIDSVEVYINTLDTLTIELNTPRVPGGHVCRFASANGIHSGKKLRAFAVLREKGIAESAYSIRL